LRDKVTTCKNSLSFDNIINSLQIKLEILLMNAILIDILFNHKSHVTKT
jgi:hypothetical protein